MSGARDFRELAAWQRAEELRELAAQILALARVRANRKYWEQLDDSSSSGPRNIAEGFGRFRPREFAQYVRIAKGSENEVLQLFIEGQKKGYISAKDFPKFETAARRAIGTAVGLIRYLENSKGPRNTGKGS